jgi:hypothetical protein
MLISVDEAKMPNNTEEIETPHIVGLSNVRRHEAFVVIFSDCFVTVHVQCMFLDKRENYGEIKKGSTYCTIESLTYSDEEIIGGIALQ